MVWMQTMAAGSAMLPSVRKGDGDAVRVTENYRWRSAACQIMRPKFVLSSSPCSRPRHRMRMSGTPTNNSQFHTCATELLFATPGRCDAEHIGTVTYNVLIGAVLPWRRPTRPSRSGPRSGGMRSNRHAARSRTQGWRSRSRVLPASCLNSRLPRMKRCQACRSLGVSNLSLGISTTAGPS